MSLFLSSWNYKLFYACLVRTHVLLHQRCILFTDESIIRNGFGEGLKDALSVKSPVGKFFVFNAWELLTLWVVSNKRLILILNFLQNLVSIPKLLPPLSPKLVQIVLLLATTTTTTTTTTITLVLCQ